jgi:hypothetical protein
MFTFQTLSYTSVFCYSFFLHTFHKMADKQARATLDIRNNAVAEI